LEPEGLSGVGVVWCSGVGVVWCASVGASVEGGHHDVVSGVAVLGAAVSVRGGAIVVLISGVVSLQCVIQPVQSKKASNRQTSCACDCTVLFQCVDTASSAWPFEMPTDTATPPTPNAAMHTARTNVPALAHGSFVHAVAKAKKATRSPIAHAATVGQKAIGKRYWKNPNVPMMVTKPTMDAPATTSPSTANTTRATMLRRVSFVLRGRYCVATSGVVASGWALIGRVTPTFAK
jgi:hypothetical protein